MELTSIGLLLLAIFSALLYRSLLAGFTRKNADLKIHKKLHPVLLLSLLLPVSIALASPPYYLLRPTLSPDHEQTQVELKNFLSSYNVFLQKDPCSRSLDGFLVSSDSGQMVCIKRYSRHLKNLRGELYSYHFSQLLGINNVPAVVISRLSYRDSLWQDWHSRLKEIGWHEGDYLVVSHYFQALSEAYLPENLKHNERLMLRGASLQKNQTKLHFQWSHLVLQDYISGENDRLVNTLVNLEHLPKMLSHPVHNLGLSGDYHLVAYDNERAFGIGYDFATGKYGETIQYKQQKYQEYFLERLCTISEEVHSNLIRLALNEDPAGYLEEYIQTVDPDSYSLIPHMNSEHRNVFSQRIRAAVAHFENCQSSGYY